MGVLGIYHKAVRHINFKGPTYFAGMLKRFKKRVEAECDYFDKSFFVMILLTDGCIHDMA